MTFLERINGRRFFYAVLVLAFFNTLLAGYYLAKKDGFHVDEQLSYGHANSTQGAFLSPDIDSFMVDVNKDIHDKWLDGKVFRDFLTVQSEERFSYGHIWENMAKDVHPPFYYVLLHTVCSFFVDVFSKWQAGVINLAAFFLTLMMLFRLSRLFFKDDLTAVLPVVLYGFSNAGIGTAIFLRMYMVQTLLAVCLVYETALVLKENRAGNKRLFLIFLYSALGILTQYVSLVFSFVLGGVVSFILLKRRNFSLLWRYAVATGMSAAVLFLVFPAAWEVLFYSQKGKVTSHLMQWAFDNPVYAVSARAERFFETYMKQLLSFDAVYGYVLGGILAVAVTSCFIGNKCKLNGLFLPMVVVLVLVNIYISLFLPVMYEFDMRYFALVLSVWAVMSVYFAKHVGECLGFDEKKVQAVLWVLVALNCVTGSFNERSAFRFQNNATDNKIFADVKDKDVFVTEGWGLGLFETAYYLRGARRIWASAELCDEALRAEMLKNPGALAVLYNSHRGRRCMACYPEKRKKVCPEMAENLEFMYTVRLGETFFDVYKVIE